MPLPALLLAAALAVPAGEWPSAGRDAANTRFSPLAQITTANVATLKTAFTFSTGVPRGHEAAPVVQGGTMYIVTPWPNVLWAIDLATRTPKWRFEPKPSAAAQGVACCDVVNRGAAVAGGRVFFNTLDNQAVAVDAQSGRELWRTALGDIRLGETMTMAPLVAGDKLIVGNSGGEFGVRGWVAALEAATGRQLWRAYSTGPDADVKIGRDFRPHYASDRGTDLGVTTWPGESWKIGGGNVWGFISYDAELDLIYHGTANPGPWNPHQRPGDNKWTAGLFARRPADGSAIWFYQWSPHDLHDYDGVNENVLVELPLGGEAARPVLLHPDRNGHLYVLDRRSGEVLSADRYAHVTTTRGVDLASGRLQYEPSKAPQVGKVVRNQCPVSPGAKDWQPSAWSPKTQLLYVPMQNLCQDVVASTVSYIAATPFVGMEVRMYAGPGGHRGEFMAWDPVQRRKTWSVAETFPVWSGALATAGDVVFYGTMDGWFKALDARSGQLLWRQKLGSGIVGQPVSYLGPDGRQYVAVLAGVGGWAGSVVAAPLDPSDATAGKGFAHAMQDLPKPAEPMGMLHVFALP